MKKNPNPCLPGGFRVITDEERNKHAEESAKKLLKKLGYTNEHKRYGKG